MIGLPTILIPLFFDRLGALISPFLFLCFALVGAFHRTGPFHTGDINQDLLMTQLFTALIVLTGHYLAKAFSRMSKQVTLATSFVIWFAVGTTYVLYTNLGDEQNSDKFEKSVMLQLDAIEKRLDVYHNALQAGLGLFQASNHVSREEWIKFAESIDLVDRYPGIKGIGFIQRIPKVQRAKFEAEVAPYYSKFKIYPVPDVENVSSSEYFTIKYIEPFDKNSKAVGLDVGSEKNRREAAEYSMRTGMPAISKKIQLVQDDQKNYGFLYFVPFFKKPLSRLQTESERIQNHVGWVYAPFKLNNLFNEALIQFDLDIHIEVRASDEENQVVYTNFVEAPSKVIFANKRQLLVGNRTFDLYWTAGPEFKSFTNRGALALCIFGVLLVLPIVWVQTTNQIVIDQSNEIIREKNRVLKIRSNEWETLLASDNIAIFQTNKEGRCIFVNQKWLKLTSLRYEEALGDGWIKGIHPEDRQAVSNEWKNSVELERDFQMEYRYGNDLKYSWVNVLATRVEGDNGKAFGHIGIGIDISEQVRARIQIENERIKSAQMNKMASLGLLAGGIAHEINNPLAIISGRSSQLRRLVEKNEDDSSLIKKQYLQLISNVDETVDRVAKIIRGLRTISRDGARDPFDRFNISTIIHETTDLFSQKLKMSQIQLTLEGPQDA
ncbi:MAG: CHASE domain-containing protein, partial [Bdellovibrionales bacterium]|nr:CHASE domain-containing protein [Bdellovibrionales bacterium]